MAQATELTRNLVKTSEVVGVNVKNRMKEDLGEIEEIILEKVEGYVRYVVLSFGGFLGMGDKLFAIPWKALQYDEAEDCFILDASKEQLKTAPGFDKNNWPNMADTKWGESIHNFYGTRPYWKDKETSSRL